MNKPNVVCFLSLQQNAFPYHDPDLYPVRTLGYRYSSYVAECNEIFFQTPPAPLLTQYKDVPEVKLTFPAMDVFYLKIGVSVHL